MSPNLKTRPDITLRLPRDHEESEFLLAHAATSPDTPSFLHGYRDGMPFESYLAVLAERAQGINLATAQSVPTTFLFAFIGTRIAGRVSIRHSLNESLAQEGGHIGYVVVPEFRRHGVATEVLRQAIPIARQKSGETRLLLTCDDDNVASAKTIERNGGVLENLVQSLDRPKPIRRYWIDATQTAA